MSRTDDNPSRGSSRLGCSHYNRGCQIRGTCCGQWYSCRFCHDEAEPGHPINRHTISDMRCLSCQTIQPPAFQCTNPDCAQVMGDYFCSVCNFWTFQGSAKGTFHCDKCGICRVGGRENFFHCDSCGVCFASSLRGNHKCREANLREDCAICLEYMFDSRIAANILPCGHGFHGKCLDRVRREMRSNQCPICRKSIVDTSAQQRSFVENHPLPAEVQLPPVSIFCNDCGETSADVAFHPYGLECQACHSFNTARA